jgi:hypothetical protein
MCAMGQAESIGGVVAVEPLLFDPPRTWRQQALCSLAGLMPGAPLNLARRLTPPAPQLERFKDFLASLSNTEVVALVKKLWEIREGAASFFTPLKVYVAAKELERVSQFFADTPSSDAQVYMNDADQDLIGIFKKERAWLLKQLPLTAHSQEENDDDD